MTMTEKVDAVLIGAGQANNPLPRALAQAGWSVALIEREHVGGTCVNEGCTPTKTMIASARVAHLVGGPPRGPGIRLRRGRGPTDH